MRPYRVAKIVKNLNILISSIVIVLHVRYQNCGYKIRWRTDIRTGGVYRLAIVATINISNAVDSIILLSGEELDGSSKAIGSQCVGLSVCFFPLSSKTPLYNELKFWWMTSPEMQMLLANINSGSVCHKIAMSKVI